MSAQLALGLLFFLMVVGLAATAEFVYLYLLGQNPSFRRQQRENYLIWRRRMEEWWGRAHWIELEQLVPSTLDYYRQGRNGDYVSYRL